MSEPVHNNGPLRKINVSMFRRSDLHYRVFLAKCSPQNDDKDDEDSTQLCTTSTQLFRAMRDSAVHILWFVHTRFYYRFHK